VEWAPGSGGRLQAAGGSRCEQERRSRLALSQATAGSGGSVGEQGAGEEAGSGGASKRVCAGEWRCVGAQQGEAARRSRCGTGSGAGEPEEERRQCETGGGKPAMQGGLTGVAAEACKHWTAGVEAWARAVGAGVSGASAWRRGNTRRW
jgi:hypothetical protein